jgi:two-component system response regulator AtoC
LSKRLSEQERAEIVAAVEQMQGNIAHAARTLGINRSTLYYRMRKHGLEHLLPTTTRDDGAEAPLENTHNES